MVGAPIQSWTDEDAEVSADELRAAAERAWRNRWGIPGGTPEMDERSADRAGGETDDVEREGVPPGRPTDSATRVRLPRAARRR